MFNFFFRSKSANNQARDTQKKRRMFLESLEHRQNMAADFGFDFPVVAPSDLTLIAQTPTTKMGPVQYQSAGEYVAPQSSSAGEDVFAIADSPNVFSKQVLDALEAARMNRLTVEQRTLLFVHNSEINRARLNGWITDAHYQAAQADFKRFNEALASRAAKEVGGKFTVQVAKNERFSPGTDSDYIIEIKSHDPVGDVKSMQRLYNTFVNQALEERLGKDAARALWRDDWHVQLDVDFMVDPKHVTPEQFKQIAELNNAAYSRKLAAEYERLSRLPTPAVVTDAHFVEYTKQMDELMKDKQAHLKKLHADPRLLTDPTFTAEYQRLAALEQKYIERIEAANMQLRRQEGLSPVSSPYSERYYEFIVDAKGRTVVKLRSPDSLAAQGAVRAPENLRITATASSLAPLTAQRAVYNLAESMVEANLKKFRDGRPSFDVGRDLAKMTSSMSLSEKGRLIESLQQRFGKVVATEIVKGFREEAKANIVPNNALDTTLKNAIGISDDVRGMSNLRRKVNELAAKGLKIVDAVSKVGDLMMIKDALTNYSTWVSSMAEAWDPNLTSDEREALLLKAENAALAMAKDGTMGVLFARVPTLGALYGAWELGYTGGRFILENTELGQWVDFKADQYAERMLATYDAAYGGLQELLGFRSDATDRQDQLFLIESRVIKLLKEGKLTIKEGHTALDVLSSIRKGDLWALDEIILPKGKIATEPVKPAGAAQTLQRLGWQELAGTLNGKGENIYTNRFKILLKEGDRLYTKLEIFGPTGVKAYEDIFHDYDVTMGDDVITAVKQKETTIWVKDSTPSKYWGRSGPPAYGYRLTITVVNNTDLPSKPLPIVSASEWKAEVTRLNNLTPTQAGTELWKHNWQRRIETLNQMTAPRAAAILWTRGRTDLATALNQMSADRAAEILANYTPANRTVTLNLLTAKRAAEIVQANYTWTDRIALLDGMTSKRASEVIWNYSWTDLTATLDHMTTKRASEVIWNYNWTNLTATLDHMTAKRASAVIWNYSWTNLMATLDRMTPKRTSEVLWNYSWPNFTNTLNRMTAQRAAQVISNYSSTNQSEVLSRLTPARRTEVARYL